MNMRTKSILSYFIRRPWLGIIFAMWMVISVVFFWRLRSRNSSFETPNRLYLVPEISDVNRTLCETIHVSLVCMGVCPRDVTPMLSSLLHHRQNPIHFHIIVDGVSQYTISKLFDNWGWPDVKYSCYNAELKAAKVQWIPNQYHYSGVYSLVKLLYPEILPRNLKRVIVLDIDLILLCDIAELWTLFQNMTDNQFIGLVENESDWYYEERHWPALGRGFNVGVMLLDLQKIRTKADWTALWRTAVKAHLDRYKKTDLAEQDIINVMIRDKPDIVYNISCKYNVQMSTRSLAKNCYGEDKNSVKIIHWNSPLKQSIKLPDADYFRSIYQSYRGYIGNTLREKRHRCWHTESVTENIPLSFDYV